MAKTKTEIKPNLTSSANSDSALGCDTLETPTR
jgi:hypothetical protein